MLAGRKILGRNAQGTVVILLLVLCSPVYTYSAYSGEAVDDGGGYDDDFEFFDSVDIAVDPATLRSSFAIDWGIDSHEDCTNPFTCLISNIKIYNTKNIIIRPKALVKVTLSNVTCYGLSLGLGPALQSSRNSPPGSGLQISDTNLGLSCHIVYKYTIAAIPKDHGTIDMGGDGSEFHISLAVEKDDAGVVTGVTLPSCEFILNVSHFDFTYQSHLTGIIWNQVRGNLTTTVEASIQVVLCDEIDSLLNTTLNPLLESVNSYIHTRVLPPVIPIPPKEPPSGTINFEQNSLLKVIDYFLNTIIGVSDPISINGVVNFLTNNTGAVHFSPSILGGTAARFSSLSKQFSYKNRTVEIVVELDEISLQNLNSITEMSLLRPISSSVLRSSVTWSEILFNATYVMKVFAWQGDDSEDSSLLVTLPGSVLLSAVNDRLFGDLQAFIIQQKVEKVVEDPFVFVANPVCVLDPVDEVTLLDLDLDIHSSTLDFPNPNLSIETVLFDTVTAIFNAYANVASAALGHILQDIFIPQVNSVVEETLTKSSIYINETGVCQGAVEPMKAFNQLGTYISMVILLLVALGIMIFTAYHDRHLANVYPGIIVATEVTPLINETSARQLKNDASNGDFSDVELDAPRGTKVKVLRKDRFPACRGLDRNLPWVFRSLVVVLVCVIFAVFVSALSSVGASVYLDLLFPGHGGDGERIVNLPSIFDFTLNSSLQLFKDAGVYATAVLVGLGAGVMPFVNLIIVLVIWLLPSKYMVVESRRLVMEVVMRLVQSGMILTYILTTLMVAFKIHLTPPIGDGGGIDLNVKGRYGSFAFDSAQIVFVVVVVVVYHSLRSNAKAKGEIFFSGMSTGPIKVDPQERRQNLLFSGSFLLASVTGLVLLSVGMFIDCAGFDFYGLASLAVPERRVVSLVSLSQKITSTGGSRTSEANLYVLQGIFALFTIVAPFIQIFALFVLAFLQFFVYTSFTKTTKLSNFLFVVIDLTQTFASLDMFVLLYLFLLPQMHKFATYIVADKCGPLNAILQLPKLKNWLNGYGTCFELQGRYLPGIFILMFACVFLHLSHSLALHSRKIARATS